LATTADKKPGGAFVYGWNAKIQDNLLKYGVLCILPDLWGVRNYAFPAV
jgi:hypothetical protein